MSGWQDVTYPEMAASTISSTSKIWSPRIMRNDLAPSVSVLQYWVKSIYPRFIFRAKNAKKGTFRRDHQIFSRSQNFFF